jgi:Repeat of unknown function (DUF5907)
MPTLGNALDFSKYEARNIRAHQLGTAPASPVTGQMYYNTADNTLYWWDGTVWISAKGGTLATPPATPTTQGTIQLAGDLAGTATSPQIAIGVIVDTDVASANKDGVAATPSMRTLGPGAQQAAPGNDARFTDARAPTAHHVNHEPGGSDPLNVDAAVGTGSLRTLGPGALQAMPGNRVLNVISPPTGALNVNGQYIQNVLDPVGSNDAATKNYVDGMSTGISWKQPVRVMSTASVGGGSAPGGNLTIDGIAVVNGDRVLLVGQVNAQFNGIWIANTSASWNRALDANSSAELVNAAVFVSAGTANADSAWVCITDSPITVDTTPLTWVQFSGAGQITAGTGLTKTGNTLDAIGTANRILVNADNIDIAPNYVGQSSITTLGTVTAGVWNGTAVPVANGGTGQTSAKTARETGIGAAGYYSSATHGAGTTISITQATHGLRASRGLLVQVQDEATGNVEIPDISIAATGDITVTYGASVSANSKRVTVIG